MSLISTGADWDFELIERYERSISACAQEFKLDTYPNQIEVISSEQMLDAYASAGLPVGYPHWTYGKEFIRNEQAYRRGMQGLAYEIVINSDPCIAVPVAGDGKLYVSVSMQGGRGDLKLDPEPFWKAMLQFDRNGDGRIGRDEITDDFTLPFRPELPPGHPGFGMPLPSDPVNRKEAQLKIFDWRDKNHDGFWTKEEFVADMTVGFGQPNLTAIRPGGTGDVTTSHVAWNLQNGIPEMPSPLFCSGRLYLVRDGGTLSCVNAATGQVVYRESRPLERQPRC